MGISESIGIIGGADGPTSVFLAGVLNTQALVATIVVGVVLCIFGLKLMRILAALVGFLIGAGIGAAITMLADLTGVVSFAVIIGCGVVMAVVTLLLKRVGAFFSVLCYTFGAIISILPKDKIIFVAITGVIALILAIFAAIHVDPLVVVVSSIAGGILAGPAIVTLVGLEDKMWIGYIIAAILAGVGVLVQLMMQSKKIKNSEKDFSKKVKEEASRESEVEKARMILDEALDVNLDDNQSDLNDQSDEI